MTIAIRRVDQTQRELNAPGRIPQPGQRPFISPTTAINLLSAQRSFLTTQNSFLRAWLGYYAARVRLYRELGIMALDSDGKWIEFPITPAAANEEDDAENELLIPVLPPLIPLGLQDPPDFGDGEQPAEGQSPDLVNNADHDRLTDDRDTSTGSVTTAAAREIQDFAWTKQTSVSEQYNKWDTLKPHGQMNYFCHVRPIIVRMQTPGTCCQSSGRRPEHG